MTEIPPDMVACADQMAASAANFIDRSIAALKTIVAIEGADNAIGVVKLSVIYEREIEERSALADALALAMRRLAAAEARR